MKRKEYLLVLILYVSMFYSYSQIKHFIIFIYVFVPNMMYTKKKIY